ncbi:MAG: type III-B CRISPR module-associated protein Cmr5 [Nitrososphaerota archaeon]
MKEKEESKVGESFRSRCRELPSLIEDVGLIPALSFCYAKAKKDIYEKIRNALRNASKIDDANYTEKGYGIYLYFVLKRLKDLKLIEEAHLDEPVTALEEIGKGKQRVASKLLRPYIVQMKKLSEAVFKGEAEVR